MSTIDDITLITEPSREYLSERQQVDYGKHREQCLEWLLEFGKDPDKAEGYAFMTVKNRSQRMDQYYRWVWDREDGYTANPTHEHADAYMRYLAKQDTTNAHKNNCRKALMMLYKWRHHEHGLDKWEPELSFSSNYKTTNPHALR